MRISIVLAACLALAASATAQSVSECYNGIGIYLEPAPGNPAGCTSYTGPVDPVAAYVVLLNPYNENTGAPITTLGGYQFRLEFSPQVPVQIELPPTTVDYGATPDFLIGSNIPIVNGQALLLTLEIRPFTEEPLVCFVTPLHQSSGPLPPTEIFVADADDDFSLSRGTPVSYSFEAPVFCMFADCEPLPEGSGPGAETGVWGDCWTVSEVTIPGIVGQPVLH
ncbi:hypothetical protein DRQ50_06250 [bacterium]|nr:MAG: hypothetical protein DRQ50_06250 [bacterium]